VNCLPGFTIENQSHKQLLIKTNILKFLFLNNFHGCSQKCVSNKRVSTHWPFFSLTQLDIKTTRNISTLNICSLAVNVWYRPTLEVSVIMC